MAQDVVAFPIPSVRVGRLSNIARNIVIYRIHSLNPDTIPTLILVWHHNALWVEEGDKIND